MHFTPTYSSQINQIEQQIYSIEAANINQETLKAMQNAGSAMKLGVYANAFEAASGGAANETLTELRTDLTDDRYNRFACEWAEAGATMIGGCCGVGAHHIHSLRQAMR